jgi:DeoR family ulaG and ulaABCDEF operon transcriptional repressor
MLETQRHSLILDLLDEQQVVTVTQLTRVLKASAATVRRDLSKLNEQGMLVKVHGGAEAQRSHVNVLRPSLKGPAFNANLEKQVAQKRAIARRAAELCLDGGSVIINGGSSTYMMTEFLVRRQLNILTNSVPLALDLLNTSENRVTLPGGELYREQNIVLSAFENDTIEHYRADLMFMGTPGIGQYGVMESDPLLVRAELKLKKRADRLVVLADSSKIGARSNMIVCPLTDVDVLITDRGITASDRAVFEASGVEVIIAQMDEQQPDE